MRRPFIPLVALFLVIAGGVAIWQLTTGEQSAVSSPSGDAAPAGVAARRPAPSTTTTAPTPPAPAAEDDDPVGSLLLEGQVVDQNDIPIAGAEVAISSNPRRTTTSGDDGAFSFDKLIGKSYWVSARKGNLAGGPVQRKLTDRSAPVVIRVHPGASLEVNVVAGDGAAIAGARVVVNDTRTETTDADGAASFDGLATGFAAVRAHADGYAPRSSLAQIPDNPGAKAQTTVTLTRGAELSGRVIDADGSPVAGASVTPQDVSAAMFATPDVSAATTDDSGRFTFPAVKPATYRVVATHKNHAPGSSDPVEVGTDRGQTDVIVELPPGAVVAGRVVDADEAPVAWASVRVMTRKVSMQGFGAAVRQVTTDESGGFEMTGLPRTEVQIMAIGEHAASAAVDVDLWLKPETRDLTLTLSVTGTIAGRVVDSAGEPIADASVMAYPDFWAGDFDSDAFALRGSVTATTGGGGDFAVTGLKQGGYRLIAARSQTTLRGGNGGQAARAGDTDVTLVVNAQGKLTGTVRLDNGDNPGLYTVTVGFPPGVPVDDRDGRFSLTSLEPASYDVTFTGPEFSEYIRRGVTIEPGKTTDLGTITVRRGRSVSGIVRSESGSPVPGAQVVVGKQIFGDGKHLTADIAGSSDEMFGLRRGETDDSGRFIIRSIGDKQLIVVAEHAERGRSLPVTLAQGIESSDVELTLHGFASVRGTVTSNGKPVPGAQVIATPDESPQHNTMVTAGQDGSYHIEKLGAGRYTVMGILSGGVGGGTFGKAKIKLEAGARPEVDIDIQVGNVTLQARYRGVDGAHIDAAQVFWFDDQVSATTAREIQQLFVGAEGGAKVEFAYGPDKPAVLKGLIPGPSTICVLPINGNMTDQTFLKRLQEHANELKVYCESHDIAASPTEQSYEAVVPPMDPLPDNDEAPAPQ